MAEYFCDCIQILTLKSILMSTLGKFPFDFSRVFFGSTAEKESSERINKSKLSASALRKENFLVIPIKYSSHRTTSVHLTLLPSGSYRAEKRDFQGCQLPMEVVLSGVPPRIMSSQSHTELDVVIDDEIQLLVGEAVVFGKDAVNFVDDGL